MPCQHPSPTLGEPEAIFPVLLQFSFQKGQDSVWEHKGCPGAVCAEWHQAATGQTATSSLFHGIRVSQLLQPRS